MTRRWPVRLGKRGVVALEFAIFVQVLALLFVGVADIGSVLYTRFRLNSTLSAATNYALVRQADVSPANGAGLAAALGDVVTSAVAANYANAVIIVNNGPSRTVVAGLATSAGTASQAGLCYCPTGTTTVAWGSPVACGSPCASGLRAGKFVALTASRAHNALFSNYGIIDNGVIAVHARVQTE